MRVSWAVPFLNSFEPVAEGFLGGSSTNLSFRATAPGWAGVDISIKRTDRDESNHILWAQYGRLLPGSQFLLETGEVRETDLNTVNAQGLSRSFTTQIERRTIGVTLQVRGDFDGARWWLDLNLGASSVRGGERVVKVEARPVLSWDRWAEVAEMSRDEAEMVGRALPGGWWSTKRRLGTQERYTLRACVIPMEEPAAPAESLVPRD